LLLLLRGRRDLAAGPVLDVHLLAPADAAPLLLIGLLVDRVGRDLGRLFVLDLLRQHQVQDQGQEGGDGEAGLEDEHDGVVEAQEGVVVAAVGEDVAKPAAMKLLAKTSVGALGLSGGGAYLGTRVAPNPRLKPAVRMKRVRRVKGTVAMMRIPETATALKRKVVMPPNTALGMATSAAANLAKMPMTSSQKQHA